MTEPMLEGAHASLRIASTLGPTPPPREGATLTVSLGPTHSLSLSPSFFFFHICLRDGHGGGGCIRTGHKLINFFVHPTPQHATFQAMGKRTSHPLRRDCKQSWRPSCKTTDQFPPSHFVLSYFLNAWPEKGTLASEMMPTSLLKTQLF